VRCRRVGVRGLGGIDEQREEIEMSNDVSTDISDDVGRGMSCRMSADGSER
jgi:hypothetical protein